MITNSLFLLFKLDNLRLALRGEDVRMVTRAVQVTSLQQGLEDILGIVNVHGEIVPILNLRKRLGLQDKAVEGSDFLILAETTYRPVGLIVTGVDDIYDVTEQTTVSNEPLFRGGKNIQLLCIQEKLIIVQELNEFLSTQQKLSLDQAIEQIPQ